MYTSSFHIIPGVSQSSVSYCNMTATGMNRHSQQMCGCPPRIVLSVNTGRVDGPLLATYCRGREQLVNREALCRQNLSGQGACSSGTMQDRQPV